MSIKPNKHDVIIKSVLKIMFCQKHASLFFYKNCMLQLFKLFFIASTLDSKINFKQLLIKINDLKINFFEDWILESDMENNSISELIY